MSTRTLGSPGIMERLDIRYKAHAKRHATEELAIGHTIVLSKLNAMAGQVQNWGWKSNDTTIPSVSPPSKVIITRSVEVSRTFRIRKVLDSVFFGIISSSKLRCSTTEKIPNPGKCSWNITRDKRRCSLYCISFPPRDPYEFEQKVRSCHPHHSSLPTDHLLKARFPPLNRCVSARRTRRPLLILRPARRA